VTALHSQRYGGGPEPALALHCSLAHGGEWAGVMAFLEDDLTLTAPDLPGHGKSPGWDGTGDFIGRCAQAVLAMPEMQAGAPLHLIAHSGGAVIALQVAQARPDLIRTLTLIEPTLFAAARDTPAFAATVDLFAPFEAAFDAGDLDAASAEFMAVWGNTDWADMEPRMRTRIMERIHLIRASHPALYGDSGGVLEAGRMEALGCPVVLIAGMTSPVICRIILRALKDRLPNAESVLVPEAGHMLPVTHPEVTAALIAGSVSRG
jgi:lipase